MRKCAVALLCTLMLAFSSIVAGFVCASAMSKPSVPEFSLKLVHSSSDSPAVYGIDPYTGENVTITPAKHQESTEIVITIKNQPFTPYKDSDGNLIELSYAVRSKGHFSDIWSVSGVNRDPYNDSYTVTTQSANYYAANAQIDFQVKAMIGYCKDTDFPSIYHMAPVFYGESSDWSATQTITVTNTSSAMPDTSPTPSSVTLNPSDSPHGPTETPLQPNVGASMFLGLDWVSVAVIAVTILVVAILLVCVRVFLRRRSAAASL